MVIVLSNKKQLKTIPKMTSSKKTSSTILLEDKEGISKKRVEQDDNEKALVKKGWNKMTTK